ncbi:MAG TPA: HD domain-containing phosphohydrolase [Thermodesulfovibrionales bacterium]|nr:HD domain-containing phosphohydrolase [Thermodesulfovibrionales bacterium]
MADKKSTEASRSGKDIINQLAVIIRTAQIHDPGNVAVTAAIDRLISFMNPVVKAGSTLTLELIGEFFYVNETRVRYSMEYLLNFDFLIRELKRRGVGSIVIMSPVTSADMQVFLKAFLNAAFASDPLLALSEGIADVHSLMVGPLKKVKEEGEHDIRRLVKKTYFNAVSYTKGVVTKIQTGEKVSIKKAKRVVESMVDTILAEEELLIGMTAIKDYDEYTYHHSVNVSILSIALGQRIGLNRKALTEVGLVALFHDIGKIHVPAEILNKATNFNEDDWRIMKKHPSWGVRAILKLKGLDPSSIRTAIVTFEHHLNYDMSGYPRLTKPLELDFYSKIVSLADQYDAMTSSRVYSRIPLAPDKALSVMMERAGTQLDPLLFKFFVNMIGVFPIGTLVLLDTKELGLVDGGNTMFPERPRVRIILDSKGTKIDSSVVDLREKDGQGKYLRRIVKTMDPNKYRINLAEYLL